jgi:hypothetical protein
MNAALINPVIGIFNNNTMAFNVTVQMATVGTSSSQGNKDVEKIILIIIILFVILTLLALICQCGKNYRVQLFLVSERGSSSSSISEPSAKELKKLNEMMKPLRIEELLLCLPEG